MSTTYRPMHVRTLWVIAVLVVVLAITSIGLGLAHVQSSSAESVRVPMQMTSSHAAMSGEFFWVTAA